MTIKVIFRKVSTLFLINILIFSILFLSINDGEVLEGSSLEMFKNQGSIFHDIKKIFINNLIAVIPYIIPVIGAGKFLLDIYITAFSIKFFLTDNPVSDILFLFIPHFFLEFYAMTIWFYFSFFLFRKFVIKKRTTRNRKENKHMLILLIISVILLLMSAMIEIFERRLFL